MCIYIYIIIIFYHPYIQITILIIIYHIILATICTLCEAPENNIIDSCAIQINCIIIIIIIIIIKVHCNLLAEHESHQFDSVGSVRHPGHVVDAPHHWQDLGRRGEFSEIEVFAYHG